jgi:cytidylate kinase
MNHTAIVKQYLKDRKSSDLVSEGFPFVTISRESGAGGHTLAREILRKVEKRFPGDFSEGWEVFDQKLCAIIAQDEKLGISFDALVDEEYRSEISQVIHEMIHQKASRYVVYKRVFEVVRLLATIGKCVIVGRGGMCVTADMTMGLNIRLVAGPVERLKRMMELMETGESEAVKAMRQQDRDRKRLIRDFFGKDIEDPLLYDAVFNTERLTVEEMAELVVEMMAQKMARFPKVFKRVL